jgi:hypothetical protein
MYRKLKNFFMMAVYTYIFIAIGDLVWRTVKKTGFTVANTHVFNRR